MKKVLSLVLVAVLAIGMSVSAFAAWANLDGGTGIDPYKVTAFADGVTLADFAGSDLVDLGTFFAVDDKQETINLLGLHGKNNAGDLFVVKNKDGDVLGGAAGGEVITSRVLEKGKVGVRVSYSEGKEAIESVKLNSKGVVEINFIDEYVSTGEIDFEFTVYLTFDGKGERADGVTYYGTLKNELHDYYDEDTDYIDLSGQIVAKPEANLRDVELDLGAGVEMRGVRLTEGRKYYGTADTDTTSEDDDMFDEYGFLEVYNLHTVNLSYTGNYVRLTNVSSSDYIYGYDDGELVFAGMGNENLPYFSKYYVSVKELDLGTDEEPEEPSEPADGEETPDLGGDDETVPSDNTNFNPGTGA